MWQIRATCAMECTASQHHTQVVFDENDTRLWVEEPASLVLTKQHTRRLKYAASMKRSPSLYMHSLFVLAMSNQMEDTLTLMIPSFSIFSPVFATLFIDIRICWSSLAFKGCFLWDFRTLSMMELLTHCSITVLFVDLKSFCQVCVVFYLSNCNMYFNLQITR